MEERKQIIDALVNRLQTLSQFKKVLKTYKPFELFKSFELPVICILNGDESRKYEGSRIIAEFTVILRIILYSETNLTDELNDLIGAVCDKIEEDLYLDGLSCFPMQITTIETSQGFLSPYEIADLHLVVFYTKHCNYF